MTPASSAGAKPRKPVPRGVLHTGPAILSYGFRPFFLAAALFALIDMILWLGALMGEWSIGGTAGPIAWHAHEMLFGYGAAALSGFILTAVPNWTGRLPVAGPPLLALVGLWLAGRLAMLLPALTGEWAAAAVDGLYLPVLAAIIAREVIAGRNTHNLRVVAAIGGLALLNLAFHAATLLSLDYSTLVRATVGIFSLLICLIGGRLIPSFTRNYLARAGATRLPSPIDRVDRLSLAIVLLATAAWAIAPETWWTAVLAGAAGLSQAFRLSRWQSVAALAEPLLAMLHIAFAFIALGWLAVALSALGVIATASALHVLTVGGIGAMTMAVMMRVTRAHTGRAVEASPLGMVAFGCLLLAAVLRPAAELIPDGYYAILTASAVTWMVAFALFLTEHAPMLLGVSRGRKASPEARA